MPREGLGAPDSPLRLPHTSSGWLVLNRIPHHKLATVRKMLIRVF